MAVQTLPLDYELIVYSGTSFRREFRWMPDGSTPMDFSGWYAVMPIGITNTVANKVLTSTNGGLTLTATGQIIIAMSPAETAQLQPGVAYYQLDLTDPTGYVRRFLRGRMSVVRDVTLSS